MAERPLYTLYKNLKAQNYDVPDDYNKFESALTRDGKGGADNRHAIYENLKAQNFDVPNTYERFYSALFEPRSKTSSRAKGGSVPMSAADRARFSAGAAAISASAQHTMNNAGRYNRLKQRKQKQQKDFGRVNLGTHQTPYGGDANNVVKDDFAYNPETGKAGAYVSSDNENVYSQPEAEQKQDVLDQQNNAYQEAVDTGEIPSVFDVRDKNGNYDLQENINKNGTYLTEEGARNQFDKKLADAYARKKEIEAFIAEDHRQHGNPLLSYGASIGASNGRTAEQSDYSNKLATSLALVKQQIGALEAVKQYPTSSWSEDALKALDNTAFTAKTWDFGLTDFATMGQMERIKTKMDNNLPLSGSDKMLLKSKLGADAAAALEDEKMGNIYRWTKIAGQSLPFMADFFLTGGYGGITKAISRGALKIAAKRGMGKVSAAVLKNTGIVIGDIIGSYAMAGSEQAMKTGADIMQRHLGSLYQDEKGDYKFGTFDENGNLLHEGGESMGTALYKGLTSAMVENYTEKLFGHSYGIKKGAINFMEKHGMNASAEFFKNIGKSGWYTNSKKWMEKFGINGFGEEVMEEEIGIPLHALLDGDNKFSDLLDTKQQLDIIGGMALSVGSMYAMGAGSRPVKGVYNRAQYYRFRNKVNVADSDAQNLMGDKWADIKDKIDNTTNEQMGGVLADILRQRDTMSKDQINAAINYGINLMKMRGYNVAKTAEMNAREITNEPTTPEEQHQEDIDNAYSEGHDADDADKHDIQLEHEDQMKTLAGLLNISEQQLSAMNDDELQSLTGQNDKLDQAIYDYQLSSARYQGVTDDAQDKIDMAANQAAQRVDMYTDKSRGSVRNATVKASGGVEDYGVYIISGNIATNEDGSINVADSDDMILFYDPTTNSVEHADALRFAELGDEVPADDVKAQAVADAKEKAIKEVAGIVDGTIDVGSQFKVTGADGLEHTYEILADYGDGTAAISIDGNVVENPYSLEDLQQLKDLEDQKRLEAAKAEREQMEKERADQTQETELPEETQPSFDFNQILNDNGNVVLVDVLDKDGNTKYPDSKLFLIRDTGAKAKVVEMKSDGTFVPHAVSKKNVATISSMSLDEYKQAMAETSMIEENSGAIEGDRGGIEVNDELPPVPDNVTINGDGTYSVDGAVQGGENATAPAEQTEQTPAMTLEDGTIVPMLEDGNPDFSKLTADQTAELYDSQFGEDADSVISGWVSDAKKALDKANNMTVKGKNFVEQKAAKEAKEKAIADAQAAYDSAIAIRDAYNERQLAKVEDTAEGRKELIEKARRKFARLKSAAKDDAEAVSQLYKDVVGSLLHRLYDGTGIDVTDTIPLTAEEYVASNLGAHSLNYEGTETSKGVKQETGLSREDFAKTQLLAADGKGTTIDDLVHSLWENRPSNLESLDTQDIRNALIGVLTSGFKASEARNYIENLRIAQAENILEEQKKAADNAAFAEENKAESEQQTETAPESEEKTEVDSSDEINDEENEQTNAPELSNEQQKAMEEGEKLGFPAFDKEGEPINEYVVELAKWAKKQGLGIDPTSKLNSYADLFLMCKDGFGVITLVSDEGENINQVVYFPDNVKGFDQLWKLQEEFNAGRDLKHSSNIDSELTEGAIFYDGDTAREFKEFVDKKVEKQNKVFGEQRPEEDLPFSAKENGKQQTTAERAADVEKNNVDDMKVVDNIVGEKTRKAFERLAKMMGAKIQWQYSDKLGNGWIQETKDADGNIHRTIFITLDSSITEGAQFIFGHEMTHQIKSLNPAAYNELTQLVLDTYGSDAFDKAIDETMKRYSDAGFSGRARDYYAEEVVADAIGEMIRDLNLAHTLAMKMSHPLLAAIHEILQKIKLAFFGTEYSDVTKNIIRSIEQAYVKTANGQVTNSETGEDVSFSLRQKPEPNTSNRKLKPFAGYAKVKFSLKDEKIKSIAEKFGVNEDDVAMYANAVERGSTAEAARARANIKRYLLQANEDKISSFKDIIKYTKPINEALKENFGDLDAMIEERRKQVEAQRNAMEAARKRAQEEEEKRQKHLDELSLIPTDELDKRYMDAIANNDESTAREMLDESARRNGYGDVGSDYQGQGAWAAPSNPQYESDEARRADIENSPDVNLEDIALGYNLQPDDYFDNPRAYMNNTAYGLESAHVIKNALDAIKNGEKDVKVKVYRAVPTSVKEGKLRNGDWVTPSKKYAEMHGDNRLDGKYRIIEDEVPANQLWWDGNDVNEFGFDDGKEYRYKNAKNNRKLNDLITYDNKGNVIPPSKRFNSRKSDIRFSLRDMADGKESGAADMAEDLKSLNTPDEVDDAIKTAIDDMPIGWQMANKKMIHIAQALGENRKAEIAGEEPKFSLKDGTLIKAGTYFSGGGLVEEGLKGIIDPVVAVEYDEKISGVYRNNFGQHIVTADVRDVDPKELVKQIDGEVEYFHASPVCKNYSQAKSNHAEVELDKETAASTAKFINAVKPKVVTIENVKGYKDSEAMKIITDALDANGYTWDADVYNAADYGGYTNRERLIVRAVRDGKLPEKPKKMAHKSGWYEAVEDIIPTMTEKKNGVAPWMDVRLKADGIDWRNIDKPLYVMGSAYADGKIPHAFADELLPTLRTKSGDVIVMPDGKVYRAMGRVLARVSGVSDDYKMPFSENLSHTIIGNGIPTQLTEHVIAPLLTGSDPKFSIRTYHGTGARVRDIKDADLGEELYRKLSTYVGDNAASQILSDNGLVGIKYPAGMIHGGAKEGDYNYVIFDENNANIVGNTRFSLRYDQFEHNLNQWKKDNNLPKDAQRPTIPQRNAGESAVDFLRRVDEYRKQMALWKTAPTYEQHLLSDDTALGEFNRELQRGSVLKRIAFQDSMLAIRKAQEAIMNEVGVDRLNMAEDAYTAENRSHGKGKNEFEEYNNEFLQPLRKAYHQMKKVLGNSYDNVRVYMMAKHGLERDAQMAFKKSLEADYEDVNQRSAAYKAYKNDLDRVSNDADLEFGRVDFTTWRQKDNALRGKYSPSYMDYRYDDNGIAYDYSGLSSLFDGSDFEEAAHKLVRDVETKHLAEVQALWNATNAATKKILRDGFKAGMMSKDTYEYVKGMYSHYIPLRGWDGTTADQVWDYIGGGKGAFNQTLKTAHGRTSIADDPIAYIENMAESGILLNNKNWVKQHLMLLAQNHPTSLLTLSKAWYVKSTDANGNEEWIPATPQITSQMNSNQVKAAIDAFEQKMEQLAQTGDATQQRDGLNIAYPQTHSEEREHEVRVMKDGEEYVIYVNGDPQLAQAMNNTRAHRVREIQSGKLDRAAAWLGRKMAAAYTSLSPLFIPSNYFRDLTMTLASTAIREDGRYNYLLRKNLATSWNLGFMLRDYQNGKLREKVSNGNATAKEQMFYDFMMNGGETGFVSSLDVEDLKKKFKNDLKDLDRWKANPVKVGHTIMDGIEFLNRAIEDSNRFAVYMTSIQYGRSIDEAVNDAKDVTLNFNRKGTGEYGWQMIRNLYLFINPAVQSLQTLGALAKHHPFKFTAVTAAWLASGVLVPIVNAALMSLLGGDDDKDKYWQFSKWDRRNNAIMWIPFTNEYVKIPLAQEFRAFYGIGDMIASKMMGGELAEETWSQYAEDLLGQVVDMLPLDPTGYDGNIAVSLMPNPIRPVFELAFNVDFTGKPLFKDTEYNKYDPNFTKAYVGTPDWLVRVSKMVNSIGNDYPDVQQNAIDAFGDPRYNLNNPAVVDHVLSSYLGGAYTMGSQVLGLLTKSLNDPKEIKMADIPLVSKFVSNPDDRPVTKKQGDEFWNMKENHDRAANTLSKLKKQAKVDGDYSMLERFYGSEEYKQYKQEDVKVKKYEEDKKKERAEESGEEYRPHKLNAEDVYKAHATPKDDFEDLKLKQLFTKLNGFKTSYDLLVDTAPGQSDGYYNTNKTAIDAIDEISLDKQEISELKKGFLEDGKDAYNAEDMKRIRELRKRILSVLEPANKVVVANQKAKSEKK